MDCTICNQETNKYKCPVCLAPYCSLACFKEHKTKNCTKPAIVEEPKVEKSSYELEYPTEDTLQMEQLALLKHNPAVIECLKNPHLREILNRIDSCDRPDWLLRQSMKEPIFVEFVDAIMKSVEPCEQN